MDKQKLIDQMRVLFASNFTFYLEAHNYHFNIMGPDFPQYHKFLNDIYDDAQDAIDDYGEKIRQLGAFDLGSYPDIILLSALADPRPGLTDPLQLFAQLLADNDTMIELLQQAFDTATTVKEYGLQNFLADRIDSHRQHGWMIRAILGEAP